MDDQEQQDQQHQVDQQMQSVQQQAEIEDMIACVNVMDDALLPCLTELDLNKAIMPDFEAPLTDFDEPAVQPAVETELQASDDFPPPLDHQKLYFRLTIVKEPRHEIDAMEEELKIKDELVQKQEKVIQELKKELRDRLDKHNAELERV
ncbi:hypothetical protein CISIN_1g040074mg [Citrus sinensis]|uniref:Uncharacterized protein n=1 Tax=Citrus sinensis TaxID=2711 RepID=A0A067GUD6_CITSI|nr:hypothetical protein CISIN_1g040074mg [Citrus sinensis]